jgi:hypothetical protein
MSVLSFFPAGTLPAGTPQFTYTGNFQLIDDGEGHWRIKLLSSGTFTLLNATRTMRLFMVGGGGGGGTLNGGGGGYTLNSSGSVVKDTGYPIVIGAGGAAGADGNATTGFGLTANSGLANGNGGSGGGGRYCPGASNGGNGPGGGGNGQGITTREFYEAAGDLYGGGGGGTNQGSTTNPGPAGGAGGGGAGAGYQPTGDPAYPAVAGTPNSGGGGGAAYDPGTAAAGGSGIVILSDVR